ncbi:MAG: acyl-CoA dehydrogenase [Pseudomonadales bacterium]
MSWLLLLLALSFTLYHRYSLLKSTVVIVAVLVACSFFDASSWLQWLLVLAVAGVLHAQSQRMQWLSRPALGLFKRMVPALSDTERDAIDAGTVGFEGQLLSGMPDWQQLRRIPAARLSDEEQAFLDGPVETVCAMANDWEITHTRADLPPAIWTYLKKEGFFALIIEKKYGGKEFSAYAHSQILVKLNSVSMTLGVTVSVPNSLGPAELLHRYGTDAQRDYYLPRLAKGQEIPCFALTSPDAGSDASAILDLGVVCKETIDGEEQVGMRLTWNKRYITLAPVATLIGLAFRLKDPDHILGEQEDLGITCALVPLATEGVIIGRRHFPLNVPFQNGPTQGDQVFVSLDAIIGGIERAGQGWKMLVECLSTGRAISLPSGATGAAKMAALTTGAYSRIRHQFGLPIGKMEGVQEVIARMTARTYMMDAARTMASWAIDQGERPAIPAAIVKYHVTEMSRSVINDAMDVHGGKGIMLGPSNYLARSYQGIPVSITVEGANILTRGLMIFGQGAIRCHPLLLEEMQAAAEDNLNRFDDLLFRHIGFAASNAVRSLWLGLTNALFVSKPPQRKAARYYQLLTRFSSNLAFLTDLSMASLGGELKRRERLSARLGDLLSYLYLSSTVLKLYEDRQQPATESQVVDYALQDLLYRCEQANAEIIANFPLRPLRFLLRVFLLPAGRWLQQPSDELAGNIKEAMIAPSELRASLGQGAYRSASEFGATGKLDQALQDLVDVEKAIRFAQQALDLPKQFRRLRELAERAEEEGVISAEDADLMRKAADGRWFAISVDDFDSKDIAHKAPRTATRKKATPRKKPATRKKTETDEETESA